MICFSQNVENRSFFVFQKIKGSFEPVFWVLINNQN